MCSMFADAVAKLRLANAGESNAAADASLEAHQSCNVGHGSNVGSF